MLGIRKLIRTLSYSRLFYFLFTHLLWLPIVAVFFLFLHFFSFFLSCQSATETVLNVLPVPGACHFPIANRLPSLPREYGIIAFFF